jgi:hypothetical protein
MSAKSSKNCVALVLALSAFRAQADCSPPTPSAIPDGATASEQEMLAAMKAFKQYDAAANAYLKCLETETLAQIAKRSGERASLKDKQMEAHNATVDTLQSNAGKFNKQVRIYKERPKS